MPFPEITIADYHFSLPKNLIAQYPIANRHDSRLLTYIKGELRHEKRFSNIPNLLPSNAVLYFNDTRVIPARLRFKKSSGGLIELLLLKPISPGPGFPIAMSANEAGIWEVMIGNKKRWKSEELHLTVSRNDQIVLLKAELVNSDLNYVKFSWDKNVTFGELLDWVGEMPLPPYLNRAATELDKIDYQTVYSRNEGAVAAPTAGLHFSDSVIQELHAKGIKTDYLTLHVGAGTFQPVKTKNAGDHPMHREQLIICRENIVNLLDDSKLVIAIGTTSMRTLESLYWFGVLLNKNPEATFFIPKDLPYTENWPISKADSLKNILRYMDQNEVRNITGETEIFIVPGYEFKISEGLITNYHMPGTTLILLVAAFVGKDWLKIYKEAINQEYRFLSYGDSSLLIP